MQSHGNHVSIPLFNSLKSKYSQNQHRGSHDTTAPRFPTDELLVTTDIANSPKRLLQKRAVHNKTPLGATN